MVQPLDEAAFVKASTPSQSMYRELLARSITELGKLQNALIVGRLYTIGRKNSAGAEFFWLLIIFYTIVKCP